MAKSQVFYNTSDLANLIRLAMYSHSLESFSKLSGLSTTTLFRGMRGTLATRPSKRTLCKIAAASEGRVTVNQLFLACGYSEEECLPLQNLALQNRPVIMSDDVTEIITKIDELAKIDENQFIVVLVKKIDTILAFKQTHKSEGNLNIRFALVVE